MDTGAIQVVRVTDPISRHREIRLEPYTGLPISRLCSPAADEMVWVNDCKVTPKFWDSCVPHPGDIVTVIPVVKDIVTPIVTFIANIFAIAEGSLLYGALSLAVSFGVGMGFATLVGALFPPPKPKSPSFDAGEGSQAWSWNPQNTQQQGIVRPRWYGKNKLYGNILASYTEPSETDNTDLALKLLMGLGEGPVKGIVADSIRLNDQPISNFEGVTTEEKRGTFNQTAVSFMDSVKAEYKPNTLIDYSTSIEIYDAVFHAADPVELETNQVHGLTTGDSANVCRTSGVTPSLDGIYTVTVIDTHTLTLDGTDSSDYSGAFNSGRIGPMNSSVYTTPDNDYDDLEIELYFPQGIAHLNNLGAWMTTIVYLRIEISEHEAESWETLVETEIQENTRGRATYKNFLASGTYDGGSAVAINNGTRYDIRVTNNTVDHTELGYQEEMRLGTVREVIDTAFTYPGMALLGIEALELDQLSGAIGLTCIQEGRIIRTYDGGSWTWEYSNNPAWVLWDILTQPVITGDGDGTAYDVDRYEGMDPSALDLTSFYALAEYCDDLVDDGEGGTEPRITFNGGFDVGTSVWVAANKVCEVARCIMVWNGNTIELAIDKPSDPVQLFGVGNIEADSYRRTFLPLDDRAGEIEVHYLDELQDFERTVFTAFDADLNLPENKLVLELFGVTKASEAWRLAKLHLNENRTLKSTVEFAADIDAVAVQIGDRIYVQHDVPDWDESGRVVSATADTVTLDKEVAPGGADSLIVKTYDSAAKAEILQDKTITKVVMPYPECVAHWKLDDNAADTTVADSSYNGNTGTLGGGDNTEDKSIAGKVGEAFDFNGTDDYVDCGDPFQSTFRDSFSVSFWAKPDDGHPASDQCFLGASDTTDGISKMALELKTTGKIMVQYHVEGAETYAWTESAIFADGAAANWTHIVIVADSAVGGVGGLKIYVDGALQTLGDPFYGDTSGIDFADFTTAQNLYLGAINNMSSAAQFFDGGIDNVMLFGGALTQADVTKLYNAGNGTEDLPGSIITISGSFTATPAAGDPFIFGPTSTYKKQFTVIGLKPDVEHRVKITALEYDSSIYDSDSGTPEIPMIGQHAPVSDNWLLTRRPTLEQTRTEAPYEGIGPPNIDVPVTKNLQWINNAPSAGYVSWALEGGLVGHWKLNDDAADTVVAEATPNNSDGALNGGDNTEDKSVAGKTETAFDLNGSDDYIDCGGSTSLDIQQQIGISFWIKAGAIDDDALWALVSRQSDGDLSGFAVMLDGRLDPDSQTAPRRHIHFQIGDGGWHTTNVNAVVPTDEWVHIVVTRAANEDAIVYYNNVAQSLTSVAWTGDITYDKNLFIGAQPEATPTRYYDGIIDNVMVFSKKLSVDDVDDLYNAGAGTESATSGDSILFHAAGASYEITPGNSDKKYIYWDPANPEEFAGSDTQQDAILEGKFLACFNDNGIAYPAFARQVIHAGILQAKTITADLGQIGDLAVDTLQIADRAVTVPVAAYEDGDTTCTGYDELDVVEVSITTTGGEVYIIASARMSGTLQVAPKIYRDSDLIFDTIQIAQANIVTLTTIDEPEAGTYTYKLAVAGTNLTITDRTIYCLETKK